MRNTMKHLMLVALLSFSAITAHAEFDMLSKRYITAYDFQNRLIGFFGDVFAKYSNLYKCNEAIPKFGFSQPASGQPLSHEPNADTIKTINQCLTSSFETTGVYLRISTREQYIKVMSQFVPQAILETKIAANAYSISWHESRLSTLTKEEQDQMVALMVENFLGIDEVVLSYGVIKDMQAYRTYVQSKLKQDDTILEVITKLSIELALRDEFLTY